MSPSGSASRKASESRATILSQIRSPLIFFGLLLLVVEGSFGVCLWRYSYSEYLIKILAAWMGSLFLIATLAVTFLTYKVPKHIQQLQVDSKETIELQAKRVREAIRLIMEYTQSKEQQRNPIALLALLDKVEALLVGAPIDSADVSAARTDKNIVRVNK